MKLKIPLGSIKVGATAAIVLGVAVTVASLQGIFGPVPQALDETSLPVLPTIAAQETGMTSAETAADPTETPETGLPEETGETGEPTDGQTGDAGAIAARWVDGKRVPLTWDELAAFEKQLYNCKTQAEIEQLMSTLAYYNRGINMAKFDFYWDSLNDLYSDEQIALMRSCEKRIVTLPKLVGREIHDAYTYSMRLGVICRFTYRYSESTDVPVGYCYYQDLEAGTTGNAMGAITVYVQAPTVLLGQYFHWDPDDWDFDINDVAEDVRQGGEYLIKAPDVVGLTEAQALARLADQGFTNVHVEYQHAYDGTEPGVCLGQQYKADLIIYNTTSFTIYVQDALLVVPDVIGLTEEQAVAVLKNGGFTANVIYMARPDIDIGYGFVMQQVYDGGYLTDETEISIYIQDYQEPDVPAETSSP